MIRWLLALFARPACPSADIDRARREAWQRGALKPR